MAATDHDDIELLGMAHGIGGARTAPEELGQATIVENRRIVGALRRRRPCASIIPTTMECRPGCAACCIAPSISSAIPGMPLGKPAGMACVQLDAALRCRLVGLPQRPAVCAGLQPSTEMCGNDRQHAMRWLCRLEEDTAGERR